MEKSPLQLKYPDLQQSEEVQEAVEKEERLSGETIPNNPNERIEAYTDRLENIFLNKDERVRARNIEMLREPIYDAFITKRENVPESYFALQQRVARERGQPVDEIPPDMREQMIDTVIEDQKASLDQWIDYLSSDDAVYPPWFKYFVFRNITKLSQFDKELGKFKTRTDSTVAPFPDIYREPLAQIADAYTQVAEDNKSLSDPEIKEVFSQKFPAIYAELIQKSLATTLESKEEIQGEWVKYEHGNMDDAERLFESLESKGTGWCTAGRSTAETQIESGDFYVYYTNDQDGTPTQPRIAIRMQDDHIAEVRGILPHQSMEPQMAPILEAKLQEFGPEADKFTKKSEDMKRLTAIDNKTQKSEALTKDELTFLYEINVPIEGFGYQKDPRIEELLDQRNPEEDMLVIFDCTQEQIAHNESEITDNTKAYVGELYPGIFQTNIEHIYRTFPEGKVQRYDIEIGGKTAGEYTTALMEKHIQISNYATQLLESPDFVTLPSGERAALVRLTVGDLGFTSGATTDEIYQKAQEWGLELCPPEVGPALRLAYSGSDWVRIAMKQISDRDGGPGVFYLSRSDGGPWLNTSHARPDSRWDSYNSFVFRTRKVDA
jgi:hypothetical protein